MKLEDKYPGAVILKDGRGKFINAYDESALVLSFLLNYKINNGSRVGFPRTALGKVRVELEKNKISYVILNKNNVVEHYHNLKNLSNFDNIIKNAKEKIDDIKEIDKIMKLLEKCSDETLGKIRVEIEKCLI